MKHAEMGIQVKGGGKEEERDGKDVRRGRGEEPSANTKNEHKKGKNDEEQGEGVTGKFQSSAARIHKEKKKRVEEERRHWTEEEK